MMTKELREARALLKRRRVELEQELEGVIHALEGFDQIAQTSRNGSAPTARRKQRRPRASRRENARQVLESLRKDGEETIAGLQERLDKARSTVRTALVDLMADDKVKIAVHDPKRGHIYAYREIKVAPGQSDPVEG